MRALLEALCGRHFWIPGYLALALGLLLPGGDWSRLAPGVPALLGGILFFACLRIPWREVASAVGDRPRWALVGGLTVLKLLVLPLAAWLVVRLVAPAWAPGLLLVALMPAGLSSVAMAGLVGGSPVMALLLVVGSSLLCPLTVPGVLALLAGDAPSAAGMAGQALYILLLLAIPFAAAQALRRWLPGPVERHRADWGMASIACSLLLILVSALVARGAWRGYGWADLAAPLGLATVVIALNAAAAAILARCIPRADAAAFACGALWLNNGLAVAVAARFYPGDGRMLLPAVAVQVPIIAAVALLGLRHRRSLEPALAADA